jgi:hypothetical protein
MRPPAPPLTDHPATAMLTIAFRIRSALTRCAMTTPSTRFVQVLTAARPFRERRV